MLLLLFAEDVVDVPLLKNFTSSFVEIDNEKLFIEEDSSIPTLIPVFFRTFFVFVAPDA